MNRRTVLVLAICVEKYPSWLHTATFAITLIELVEISAVNNKLQKSIE
jgi:hypothetical protein